MRIEAGEEESIVEITMDTSVMDYSIIEEQGRLPDALSKEEEMEYAHLVKIEGNYIQWRYKAALYLNSLIIRVKNMQMEGKEMRDPGQACPKLWTYLGMIVGSEFATYVLRPLVVSIPSDPPATCRNAPAQSYIAHTSQLPGTRLPPAEPLDAHCLPD